MAKLNREGLWSLEQYSEKRNEYRAQVMAHKKKRQVAVGDNTRLYFEDETTMRYQIQEILRIEKVFDAEGIEEELEAYNPLIPDGSNLKATFMVEYDDEDERKQQLSQLIGIERQIYIVVDDFEKIYPIADEDLEREDGTKTSSVHFLRFEFSDDVKAAVKSGSDILIGIEHPDYTIAPKAVESAVRESLASDFE